MSLPATNLPPAEENLNKNNEKSNSFAISFNTAAIVGSTTIVVQLIGLLRNKVVANFLGAEGIGFFSLFNTSLGTLQSLTTFGTDASAVREIAAANSSGNTTQLSIAYKSLKRLCLFTGFSVGLLVITFATHLSELLFNTNSHSQSIVLMGCTLFLNTLNTGQSTYLSGTRRIPVLSYLSITASLLSVVATISCIYRWKEDGVAISILLSAALSLIIYTLAIRRMTSHLTIVTWTTTLKAAITMLRAGASFMWSGLAASGAAMFIRTTVSHDFGIEALGLYTAAWTVSTMLANFVLGALGKDFYPRLAGISEDNNAITRLVNEQISVAMLLAVPGLLLSMAFSRTLLSLLFSSDFTSAAILTLPFTIGVFFQVVLFPLGYIQRAKREGHKYIYLSQTFANALLCILSYTFMQYLSIFGAALAVPSMYLAHSIMTIYIAKRLCKFKYTPETIQLQWTGLALVSSVAFLCYLSSYSSIVKYGAFSLATAGAAWAIHKLLKLLPSDHILNKFLRVRLFRSGM